MDLSKYKKVEHKDGRIELIPKKESDNYYQFIKNEGDSIKLSCFSSPIMIGNTISAQECGEDWRLKELLLSKRFYKMELVESEDHYHIRLKIK